MHARSTPRPDPRHAGYALLLVIIAIAFASALGTSMILSRGPAAAVAGNVRLAGDARALAEAALELTVDMAIQDDAFRDAYAHDAWSADQPFGQGTFRVKFADPEDADLANDPTQDVRITVRAEVDGRSHEVAALFTPPRPRHRFEVGRFTAGPTPTTVSFQNTYENPVVVCTPNITNNAPDRSVVVRVQNVGANSFEVYLQNPGDVSTPVADEVHFLAMEQGAHEFDGVKAEAWTIEADLVDRRGASDAIAAEYLQDYDRPIVLGQVMTANDPRWSMFWCRGSLRRRAPEPGTLRVGRHVGEDTDTARSRETLGVIVFEAGTHVIGGTTVQAFLTGQEVEGVGPDGDQVTKPDFPEIFDQPPQYALANQAGEVGGDMSWAVFPDADPLHADHHIHLALDEDQIGDAERDHDPERVFVVAFQDAPNDSLGAGLNVLMAVEDKGSMTAEDNTRLALLQSWGMNVSLCDDADGNDEKIAAMEAADVVYISAQVGEPAWRNLIDDLAVPFVNEHPGLVNDLGFASGATSTGGEREIAIVDTGHPITQGLSLDDNYEITDAHEDMLVLTGSLALGGQTLAERSPPDTGAALMALEIGAQRHTLWSTPSRRVQLPWGDENFDPAELNGAGQELLLRSLVWAAGGASRDSPWITPPNLVWEEPSE